MRDEKAKMKIKTGGLPYVIIVLAIAWVPLAHAEVFDNLAQDFWTWRAAEMPVSSDDIPRLKRPAGWVAGWSGPAVENFRAAVSRFEQRLNAIDASKWPVARQVDYRLLASAIARARWELD